ncbi:MAG TPA: hypothetical protein VFD98_14490 [Terracidiphilus sp.]|nr:hypothetical protein [Terracidiphilus sp.]
MKFLLSVFFLSVAALAENPQDAKVITFNRTDTEHCRVIMASGKPLLESSFGGTSVAISMPENRGNGEFSVYVSIYQLGYGAAHVVPKDFSAVFSDPGHTRFQFFDKAKEVGSQGPAQPMSPGMSATNNEVDRSMIRGGGAGPGAAGLSPSETLKGDNLPGAPNAAPPPEMPAAVPVFLQRATVKQGSRASGLVYFRKPKGSKLEVSPTAMLDEIDVPVNGIIFRF